MQTGFYVINKIFDDSLSKIYVSWECTHTHTLYIYIRRGNDHCTGVAATQNAADRLSAAVMNGSIQEIYEGLHNWSWDMKL